MTEVKDIMAAAGVFKGADSLPKFVNKQEFWDKQPYSNRLYFGDNADEYITRGHFQTAITALTHLSEQNAAKDKEIAELKKQQIYITDEYREERAGEGFWYSCSGCHSTNEGASTGWYSVHPFFECEIGSGCSECGYLGARWDNIDYEEMARLDREECEREAEEARQALSLSEGET